MTISNDGKRLASSEVWYAFQGFFCVGSEMNSWSLFGEFSLVYGGFLVFFAIRHFMHSLDQILLSFRLFLFGFFFRGICRSFNEGGRSSSSGHAIQQISWSYLKWIMRREWMGVYCLTFEIAFGTRSKYLSWLDDTVTDECIVSTPVIPIITTFLPGNWLTSSLYLHESCMPLPAHIINRILPTVDSW